MKNLRLVLCVLTALGLAGSVQAEQTLLKAFAPADSDGSQVVLVVDWAQARTLSPDLAWVMLRQRPDGPPTVPDTLAFLPVDSTRFVVTGLDPERAYHFFASFKKQDSSTVQFGSFPAVVHLGPVHSRPHAH